MSRDILRDLRPPFYQIEHELLDRGLSANAVAVYNVLRRHANQRQQCFPSIRKIARSLRLGVATVRRALDELIGASVIRQTPRIGPRGDRTSNLYELLPILPEGCSATDTRVPLQIHRVPQQIHGCSATGTELYPIEQELVKESVPNDSDPLWKHFCAGFLSQNHHTPRRSTVQKTTWNELIGMHSADLITAKIDAWWNYQSPRLDGNHSVGAFLQWFDDIPLAVHHLTIEPGGLNRATALQSGTAVGRQVYEGVVGDLADRDAKIRTLIAYGFAQGESDARRLVELYEPPCA